MIRAVAIVGMIVCVLAIVAAFILIGFALTGGPWWLWLTALGAIAVAFVGLDAASMGTWISILRDMDA